MSEIDHQMISIQNKNRTHDMNHYFSNKNVKHIYAVNYLRT